MRTGAIVASGEVVGNQFLARQMMRKTDVVIIGGGIVGLATAYQLTLRFPERRVVLLEKEDGLGRHQTGHNSGVLHSGIYYKPGSLKAINCRDGKKAMEAFCRAEGIPYQICGKVIVAVSEADLPALERIYERGVANGVRCELIDKARLAELEPHAAGVRAIHVPETGIVDYGRVVERLAQRVRERGGEVLQRAAVTGLTPTVGGLVVRSAAGDLETVYAINCAGLHSDRVAAFT